MLDIISSWYFILMLLQPFYFSAFSYSHLDLLKASSLEEFFKSLLLMNLGSCFIIFGGWFQLLYIYSSLYIAHLHIYNIYIYKPLSV